MYAHTPIYIQHAHDQLPAAEQRIVLCCGKTCLDKSLVLINDGHVGFGAFFIQRDIPIILIK